VCSSDLGTCRRKHTRNAERYENVLLQERSEGEPKLASFISPDTLSLLQDHSISSSSLTTETESKPQPHESKEKENVPHNSASLVREEELKELEAEVAALASQPVVTDPLSERVAAIFQSDDHAIFQSDDISG